MQVSCLCKSSTKKLLCAFVITYLLRIVKKEWFVVYVTYVDYVTLTNGAYQYSTYGFSSFCQEEDGYNAESDLEVRGGCSEHNYSIIYVHA